MNRCRYHRYVVIIAAAALAGVCLGQDVERRALGPRPATSAPEGERTTAAPGTGVSTFQTAMALGVVLALIGGAAWGVRRLARNGAGGLMGALGPGGRAPSGLLEVLARYPVGRGSTLVLLKLDRRVLLVNQSHARGAGGAMSTLCEITDPEDVASILVKARDQEGDSLARRFQQTLSQERSEFEPTEAPRQPIAPKRVAAAPKPAAPKPAVEPPSPGVEAVRGRLRMIRATRGVEVRA